MSAPIPVAVVFSSFEPGGTEHQMMELIKRVDRARWAVHVVSMRTSGRWLDRIPADARLVTFPVTSFQRPAIIPHVVSFSRWCRQNRIAIVHSTDLPSNIFGMAGATLAGVPVRIASRREVNPGRQLIQLGAQRLAYACAHRIVANCRAASDRLQAEHVPAGKITVIPNGVQTRPLPRPYRPRVRRVVTVANLRPEKGHDVLIDAAALVVRRFPDARFDIVGGGPLMNELTKRVHDRQLEHAVTFLGHQQDVSPWLDAADVLVLPSRSEAFPNAVLEGMAAGLAVVASAIGGVPEIIDEGRTGLLAVPGDAADLADKIGALMDDASVAARIAAAAQHEVSARYSFARMVAQFEDLYTTELCRRGLLKLAPLAPAS